MKKVLFLSAAIVIAATSCQKKTDGTAPTVNNTNPTTGKRTIATFGATPSGNPDLNTSYWGGQPHGGTGDVYNVDGLRDASRFWDGNVVRDGVTYPTTYCEADFDGVHDTVPNAHDKSGAEMIRRFLIPAFTDGRETFNGSTVQISGTFYIPKTTGYGYTNHGGWVIQTSVDVANPPNYGFSYSPLVHVSIDDYGVGFGYYNYGSFNYTTGTYPSSNAGQIVTSESPYGNTYTVVLTIQFHAPTASIWCQATNLATGVTTEKSVEYQLIDNGSNFPLNPNIQTSTGCYPSHPGAAYGITGVQWENLKAWYP